MFWNLDVPLGFGYWFMDWGKLKSKLLNILRPIFLKNIFWNYFLIKVKYLHSGIAQYFNNVKSIKGSWLCSSFTCDLFYMPSLMCRTVKYAWIVICQLMHDRSDDEEDPTLLWINTSDRRTDERPVAPAPAGRPASQSGSGDGKYQVGWGAERK